MMLTYSSLFGQNIKGTIACGSNNKPIPFVNIGIPSKDIGTVSDINGTFSLSVTSKYYNDTLLISCIGYEPYKEKVASLLKSNNTITLKEKAYAINEIVVRNKKFKAKLLGVENGSGKVIAGFKENRLGYEIGILVRNKKIARIKKVNLNIAKCTYDSVHYRLNIYKALPNNQFEIINDEPIYIKFPMKNVSQLNITLGKELVVEGDFLVSLENIKDQGSGKIFFKTTLLNKSIYRKTSQSKWESSPFGVAFNVIADVEI